MNILHPHGSGLILHGNSVFVHLQVKEIEQEAYTEPETVQQKDTKQTAAVDLSKRLKDFRSINDAASLKGDLPYHSISH